MAFLRIFFTVLVLTAIGLGVMFYPRLKPIGDSVYAYVLGLQAYHDKQFDVAWIDFRAAQKAFPMPYYVYLYQGDTAVQLKRWQRAEDAYTLALNFKPQSAETLERLAIVETRLGHRHVALGLYREVLGLQPQNLRAQRALSSLYLKIARESGIKEDVEQAQNQLKAYLKRAPEDDSARYQLGEMQFALGQYGAALQTYCDLAVLHPENPETLYSLAASFAKNNDLEMASQLLADGAEQMAAQKRPEAKQWFTQALAFKSAVGFKHMSLGKTALACRAQLAKAQTEAQKGE